MLDEAQQRREADATTDRRTDLFALDAHAFLLFLALPPFRPSVLPPPPLPLQFVRARQGRLTSFRLANFLDYLPVESSKAPTYPLLPPTQTPRLFLPCRVPSHLDGYLFFGLHRMVLALHFAPLLHIFKLFERMLTEFEFQFLWHVSYPSSEPIYLVAQKDQIQETNS